MKGMNLSSLEFRQINALHCHPALGTVVSSTCLGAFSNYENTQAKQKSFAHLIKLGCNFGISTLWESQIFDQVLRIANISTASCWKISWLTTLRF